MSISTSPPETADPETRDERRAEVIRLFARTGEPLPKPLREETRRVAWRLFVEPGAAAGQKLPLNLGDKIGPYRAVRLLGEGGQGWVYEAVHEQLERRVAIKIPRPEVTDRLLSEARLMVKLTHPRIVQVMDVVTDGAMPYMVMELCQGGSLDQRLELNPDGLPIEEVRRIAEAVLEALAFAHARGVVHRDVKPANVLFDERDQPRLADLGTGAIGTIPDLQHSIDKSGSAPPPIEGTPLYMAPEQERPGLLAGEPIDGRADLFALGKLLFRLLTGSSPAMVRPPSRMRGDLDPAWDEYLFHLLEENRARRPASAEAALAALRKLPGPRTSGKVEVRARPTPPAVVVPAPVRRRPAATAYGLLSLATLFFLAFLEVRFPTWGVHGWAFLPLKLGTALVGLSLRWYRRLELRLKKETPVPYAVLLAGVTGAWVPLLFGLVHPRGSGFASLPFAELALLGTALTTLVTLAARIELFRGREVVVIERGAGDRFFDVMATVGLGTLAALLITASLTVWILIQCGVGY